MYFTNISNRELQRFHKVVKNNFNINLVDVEDNPLFVVEKMDELMRIYPLFYTDKIESSNSNDKVLGNQCIICENKTETKLYFIVDETVALLSLDYSYNTDNTNYWSFYLFDGGSGNSLTNVTCKATFKANDETVTEMELNSDKNGLIYINTVNIDYDEVNIVFTLLNASKTFNWSI